MCLVEQHDDPETHSSNSPLNMKHTFHSKTFNGTWMKIDLPEPTMDQERIGGSKTAFGTRAQISNWFWPHAQ